MCTVSLYRWKWSFMLKDTVVSVLRSLSISTPTPHDKYYFKCFELWKMNNYLLMYVICVPLVICCSITTTPFCTNNFINISKAMLCVYPIIIQQLSYRVFTFQMGYVANLNLVC